MKILNFGSMNLDYIYAVEHFVKPGETLDAISRSVKCGGKGLNQSIAMARAGLKVFHAGCVGTGGECLQALLRENGVNTDLLVPVEEMQGHAVIQVNHAGENCIILYGGSNRFINEKQVADALSRFGEGDYLVLQNEINLLPQIIEAASRRGMKILMNPSPCDDTLRDVDMGKLAWVFMNETEAEYITGEADPDKAWNILHGRYPHLSLLVTLGSEGSAAYRTTDRGTETARQQAVPVKAVDTTGAGDTYTGYFIAGLAENMPLEDCMKRASQAATICVTRLGAAGSIPLINEFK